MYRRVSKSSNQSKSILSVSLCVFLDFFLFLDRVRRRVVVGSEHDFGGQDFGNIFGLFERGLSGVVGEEEDGLGDSSERRHIDGLSLGGTTLTDLGGVFSRTAVGNGVDHDLGLVSPGL